MRDSKQLHTGPPKPQAPRLLRRRGRACIFAFRAESRGPMRHSGASSSCLAALTTAPSVEAARRLVRQLVERRLVACGTVLPGAVSTYWWRGAVADEEEVVVILKTTVARWTELAAALPALHPYEVPELIALPVVAGHAPYLEWLRRETAAPRGAGGSRRSGKRKE
jgi:periplasmic divalent cation tolerance protein